MFQFQCRASITLRARHWQAHLSNRSRVTFRCFQHPQNISRVKIEIEERFYFLLDMLGRGGRQATAQLVVLTHITTTSHIYIYRLVRKRSHIGKEVVAMRRSMRQNRLHKYINTLPGTATQNILMLFTMEETPERQAETIGTKMETKRVNINQLAKPTKSKRGSIHK